VERHRKDAKALAKAFRAGDPEAIARAEDVLGARARERFLLSDAQHVVAVEHGYRTWPELKRAVESAAPERPVARIGLQPVSHYEERAARLEDDPDAVRRVRATVPRLADYAGGPIEPRDAKLVTAREHGFATWRELVAEVERVRAEHEGQREGSPEVVAALEAIRRDDRDALAALLDEHPELLHRPHHGAWRTLLEAIAQPDTIGDAVPRKVVGLLIERGAELEEPLGLAACFDRVELVELLLAAGAHATPSAIWGITPLETALYHGSRASADLIARERGISPYAVWTVAALGRVDLLPVEPTGPRPNLADVGWPPGAPTRDEPQEILDEALCFAALNGRDEAVLWLLAHGANVNGRPYLDVAPLHFAVQFGRVSTLRLLLRHGADTTIRDRIHDGTPLDWARSLGRTEIARELDAIVDTGLEYRPGDPVRVRIVRHGGRVAVTDDGAAVERVGRPDGWRDVARRIDDGLVVNVSRRGVVSLPVVRAGPGLEPIVRRIAAASLALYQDLLELEG
jgi:ankyrin repeat protein